MSAWEDGGQENVREERRTGEAWGQSTWVLRLRWGGGIAGGGGAFRGHTEVKLVVIKEASIKCCPRP